MLRLGTIFTTIAAACLFLAPHYQPASSSSVKVLDISDENHNAGLIRDLAEYPNLERLSISCLESLQALPESIGKLAKLRELKIDNGNGCSMNPALPESIGNLHSLQKLILYGAQDPRDPETQPAIRHQFPRAMSRLKNLTYLDLGRNGFSEVPSFVRDLPNLREFGFEWNINLQRVPQFLCSLRQLTRLRLDANGLTDLPECLNTLPKLTFVSLGDNCKITQKPAKMRDLSKRFARIRFDFTDEYDCPGARAPE